MRPTIAPSRFQDLTQLDEMVHPYFWKTRTFVGSVSCILKRQGTLSLLICYLSSFLRHLPIHLSSLSAQNSDPLIIHLPQRVMKFSRSCEREINYAEWRTNEGDAAEKSQCCTNGARPL